jgi:poly-beta-1,6-N-acetyl-D-glucosamine synthase
MWPPGGGAMPVTGNSGALHATLLVMFWAGFGLIGYTYVVYPLIVHLLARLFAARAGSASGALPPASVSVVISVHDEGARIVGRLQELARLVSGCGCPGEIIVVADGCRDSTAELARSFSDSLVRVLELQENQGKSHALSRGCALARGEILVFCDARQRWDTQAMAALLENFSRPEVGAVSGELMLEAASGTLVGVSLYWRYEKWLRRNESRLHSMVGVSGSIAAVRRELFRPIPQGLLLDDVYWPLRVVMQGYRVVQDERARAFDRLPDKPRDEFRRKVRTLSGNFQLIAALPQALLPWRNSVWWQFISHKLLRLLVPWLLIGVFISSIFLHGWLYQLAFWAQVAFYALALLALAGPAARLSLAGAAASFVTLNAAAWLGFWVWISGRSDRAWHKVRYAQAPGE